MDRDFAALLRAVTDDQPPRVWSLLVTIFGEMAQAPGARISGRLLTRITEEIGIKPEANRVALHRLRKDNWIESHRTGRESAYALTAWGLSQTRLASPRIYAEASLETELWFIAGEGAGEGAGDAVTPIAPGLYVSARARCDPALLCIPVAATTPLPDWVRDRVCDAKTIALAEALLRRFEALEARLAPPEALTALQIAVLRVLIVHAWRRVVLRAAALPDAAFPTGWHGPACRASVARLLAALEKPGLAALEAAVHGDRSG